MPHKTIYVISEKAWEQFSKDCKTADASMSGAISYLMDAMKKNAKDTIVALEKLKK